MTTITALPPPGQRNAPTTFATLMDAFLAQLATFQSETNTVAGEINAAATAAALAAAAAAVAGSAAAAAANAALWVTGTTYAIGDLTISPTTYQTYRRKTNGAGAADPAIDPTNWQPVTADLTNGPLLQGAAIIDGCTVTGGMTVAGGASVQGVLAVGGALTLTQAAVTGVDIDVSAGNQFSKTISGPTTFTLSNVPPAGALAGFALDLVNPGTNVTWWAGIKWDSGIAPVLTVTGRDSLYFYTYDGGTTWTGLVRGRGFA